MAAKRLHLIILISALFKYNSAIFCSPCSCKIAENSQINVSCSYNTGELTENEKLERIPSSILTSPQKEQIIVLEFKGQNLNKLDDLSTIYNVENIIFSQNIITNLNSNDLANLTFLNTIYLDNNQISEIPSEFFKNNHKISYIFLHNNHITILTRNIFANLPYLTEIHLNQNDIETIEDKCFVNVPLLKTLDLSNNKLKTLSLNFIDGLDSLFLVYLHKNPWRCDIKLCDLINTSLEKNWLHGKIPECFHSNGMKTNSTWEFLQILEPVKIRNFQSPVDVNQTIVLNCEVHVCLFPTMVWTLNGDYLKNSTHCFQDHKHTLTITLEKIRKIDEGLYTCFINNSKSSANISRYLAVNDFQVNVETTTWKEEQKTSTEIETEAPDVDKPEFCWICIVYLIIIAILIIILLLIFLPLIVCCCPGFFATKCFTWYISKFKSFVTKSSKNNKYNKHFEEVELNNLT